MPWEAVIRDAAEDRAFWQDNVRDVISFAERRPGSSAASSAEEGATLFNADVAPPGPGAGAGISKAVGGKGRRGKSPPPAQGKKAKRSSLNAQKRRKDGRHVVNSEGTEICFLWNRSREGCSERCLHKRARQCEWCLGPHRAVDPSCTVKPQGWKPPTGK